MKFKYLLAASVVSLSATTMFATPVEAQQITSGIEGRVATEDGAALPGASVVITDNRTGQVTRVTASSSGQFRADTLVPGGPYSITATAQGYEGQTVEDQFISVQGNTQFSFRLSPASAGAENVIVVSGSRAGAVQLAVGPGTGFSAEVLETAPSFDRDIRDIIRLDPRVTLDPDSSSGQNRVSCLGGNDRSNAFTVDAISQGDLYGLNGNGFASRSSTPIPFAAIRETSVEFAPFDVEYGQFTGCAINVITRSGTNEFHGSAFYEYSDEGLRGNRVADLDELAPVQAQKNWGASLGGPIIPERLFFFGAYSHQESGESFDFGPTGAGYANETPGISLDDFNRFRDILNTTYGIDTGDLVYNLPYTNDRYFGRLDFQINDDHRLEATYQRLEESTAKRGGIFTSTTSPTITGFNNFYNSGTESDYYSARLYSDWSDSFSTELRYAHSKIGDIQDPVGGGEAGTGNPIPTINVGTYDPDSDIYGSFQAGPDTFRAANDLQTSVDYYTAIARIDAGNHNFKIGAGVNRVGIFNLFVPNAVGTLNFASLDALEAGILTNGTRTSSFFGRNLYNNETVGATGAASATGDVNDAGATFDRTIYSVFAQDDWQMTDRLNAIFGVRVDMYDGDRPAYNPLFAERYNGRSNAIGFSALPVSVLPRAAFTYEAGDFGPLTQATIRVGAGIFSGGDPLVWFGNAFQNNGITYSEGRLTSSDCPGEADPYNVLAGGSFTGVPDCVFAAGQSAAARGQGDTQSIDPNIKTPSVLRFNLGFESGLDFTESGLLSNWRVKSDFIYSRFQDPFTVADLSQVVDPSEGLNGYTIDGRPIYRAIDPTVAGCTAVFQGNSPGPVFTNVNAPCFNTFRDDELVLTNSAGYDAWTASVILSKSTRSGLFTDGGQVDFLVGYAYTDANDRRAMTSSTASSNYDRTLAFDLQNPAEAESIYSNTHSISARLSLAEEFISDLRTRFSASFSARSGRHYGLAFNGGGVFNDSASGNDNALVYLPTGPGDANISPDSDMTAVQQLADFAQSLDCAKDYIGRTIARNTCENDWYFDVDLRLSQDLPGPGRLFGLDDKIQVYGMVDNFLNMLDRDWNVLRQRFYSGQQGIADIEGIDDQGRYIISGFNGVENFDSDNQIYIPASVWRIKVGVSYEF